MRRFKVVCVACLVLALASGALAQATDVPTNHWAYRAVQALIERGYIDVGSDGAFRGDQPADRYTVAAVVGRLLDDIEAGRVRVREGTDAALVRQLEQEFRAELVQWHADRQALQDAYSQTQRAVAVIDVQLNDILAQLEWLESVLAEFEEANAAAHDAIYGAMSELQAGLADHDVQLRQVREELAQRAQELRLRLDGLQEALQEALEQQGLTLGEEFGQRLGEQRTALARVEQDLRKLDADVAELRAQMDEELYRLANLINEQAAALAWRIGELEAAVNERLDAQVTGLTEKLAGQEAQVAEIRTRLDDVERRSVADNQSLGDEVVFLRQQLAQLEAELAEQRQLLQQQGAALMQADAQFLQDIQSLRLDAQTLRQRTDALERYVLANEAAINLLRQDLEAALSQEREERAVLRQDVTELQTVVREMQEILGTSEEYLAALLDELQRRMDTQLSSSVAREALLRRQLSELQAELDSFRTQQGEEIGSLRSTGNLAVGAAVLAILLGLTK